MKTMHAFRIRQDDSGRHQAGIEQLAIADPAPGEVLLRVTHSSVNYKDALAVTGQGKILRRLPLTGGIDASGIVEVSAHADFSPGAAALATGWGLSCDHDGGYAQYLCLPGDWLTPLPAGLERAESMTLGTAGLTAALALWQMHRNGQEPDMGPILVTGASGGVGSIAVSMLARLGFRVTAVSGKISLHPWLRALGATETLTPEQLPGGERPLEKAIWGGAIDNVGGAMLARITRTLVPEGCIASIGLAGGSALDTTVMPFILRGIKLLGCNSVDIPAPLRRTLWQRLATDWRPDLDSIRTATIGLDQLPAVCARLLTGHTHGRILVDLAAG